MTDEVGQHLRISLTVWMIGAILGVVVTVTAVALSVFNNYTGKYSDAMVQATEGGIYALAAQSSVTCPQAYATITASISTVDQVKVSLSGAVSNVVYYDYQDPTKDRMVQLMSGANAIKNVRLEITPSTRNKGMIIITLTEVVRE